MFAALLIIATGVFIYIGRQQAKTLMFSITDIGLFLADDFLRLDEIQGFNIIDDPGARARLILRLDKTMRVNEIIPIYDMHIADIEEALEGLGIQRDETLEPNLLDQITQVV